MPKNIFVVGLDELNHSTLEALPGAEEYSFHQLLDTSEFQKDDISIPDLLENAHRRLDAFEGSVDAIVGYWDFPVTLLVPILCDRYGLTSADLEAVVKCEHKYWSRLEQQKVIDEHPGFALLDLDDDEPALPEGLSYPVWVKPVKSTESAGAYYIEDDDQLKDAVAQERQEVGRLGGPFNDVLAMMDLPPEIAEIGGSAAMVEEAATGDQLTVEGYARDGRVEVYGVIDSLNYPDTSSFLRYQYPSRLPAELQERIAEVSRTVIRAIGLSNTTFNIEYFWDPETERLSLLEINPRHSQSHAPMFQLVDGVANHKLMIELGLDREPKLTRGEGSHGVAAKWYLRRFADGVVRRTPTAEEIDRVEEQIPGTRVQVAVEEGQRLSETFLGDSYSYVLAEIFNGGRDEDDLVANYDACLEALTFEIDDTHEGD